MNPTDFLPDNIKMAVKIAAQVAKLAHQPIIALQKRSAAYKLLDVPFGSSSEDVKHAFKKKALEFHPDRNRGVDTTAKMRGLQEAMKILEVPFSLKAVYGFK